MANAAEPPADRALLRRLLRDYNEHPEGRDRVVAEIDRRFRRRVAVLVLDTSGFSRAVRASGIVHFLALLERMERLVGPVVERAGGRVLRQEADNLYAVFPHPDGAVSAAGEVREELRALNEMLPEDEEVYVAMGIGYGDVLMVGPDDLYGDEMNLASKLGEDLAGQEEVLLSPAARNALTGSGHEFEEVQLSVSGLTLTAYRLLS